MRRYMIGLCLLLIGCVSYNRHDPALEASYDPTAQGNVYQELMLTTGVTTPNPIIRGETVIIWLAVKNLSRETVHRCSSTTCTWQFRVWNADGALVDVHPAGGFFQKTCLSFPPEEVVVLEFDCQYEDLPSGKYKVVGGLGCQVETAQTAPPVWVELF